MGTEANAGGAATSGWSTEAKPGDGQPSGNPTLCKSFERGIIDRIAVMRTLRFGGKKPPPLLPQDLREWHLKTQMDPNATKKYAAEEAMVKRLNGYMVDNGCTPVDVDEELLRGRMKAEKR